MMLKGSFSSLPSYKYGRFKPNFFCGTIVSGGTNDDEEDVEDAACLVFGSCHDHSSRGLTLIIKGITGIHNYVTVKKHCTTKFARKSEM